MLVLSGVTAAQRKRKPKSPPTPPSPVFVLKEEPKAKCANDSVNELLKYDPSGTVVSTESRPGESAKTDCSPDNAGSSSGAKGLSSPLKILSKPKANYTDAARANKVSGRVKLTVTFLASGRVGSIRPLAGLPNGLTEQAVIAARNIRFEPERRNGAPVSVSRIVVYDFAIY